MFCKKCGAQIFDGDKFCRSCGTTVTMESGNSDYLFQEPQKRETWTSDWDDESKPVKKNAKKKSGGKGLLIGGIGILLVIAVAAVALVLTLGTPAAKVASAVKASVGEFSKASGNLKLGQALPLLKADEVSQSMELRFLSLDPDYFGSSAEALAGLGVRVDADVSLPDREIGIRMAPVFGSAELINAEMTVDDDIVALSVPELFPDPAYGFSTMTMMEDLERMGADVDEFGSVRFNVFDLIETARSWSEENTIDREKLEKANAELLKTITVEKGEKTTLTVCGNDLKCAGYLVTVPRSGLKSWLRTVESQMNAADNAELMERLGSQMNLPQYMIDEMTEEMATGQVDFDDLYDVLDELGDVELQVYLYKGKVAAVVYSDKIDGSKVEIGLYIGGDESYVDAVTLEMIVDKDKLSVVSKGDHAAKDGAFTDKTVITLPNKEKYTLETKYDPSANSDNLRFAVKWDIDEIAVKGTLVDRPDQLELRLDEVTVTEDGTEALSISASYTLTGYSKRVDLGNATMILEKDYQALMEIMDAIETNLEIWSYSLLTQYPEIASGLG